MDYREQFLTNVGAKISRVQDIEQSSIDSIMNAIITELQNYDMTKRTTEVATYDDSSEKLLQLYAGTLLTSGKSKKTVSAYVRLLRRFYIDINKPLKDVMPMDIKYWLARMQQTVSLRSCENYRSYISAFYFWMSREQLIESNPAENISPVKYPEEIRKGFTDLEIDDIRMACTTKRRRAIVELLLSSGMRVSEMCALAIDDVNFTEKTINVQEGKGGKQRTVFITDVCANHLAQYLGTRKDDMTNLFVTRNKTPMNPDAVRDELYSIGKAAGVNDVHPHKFRRTFASNMSKKGMDIHTIQKILGHSNINTTTIYISTNEEFLHSEYKRYA